MPSSRSGSESGPIARAFLVATVALTVLAMGLICAEVASARAMYQWDLKCYWYAGAAYREGRDPHLPSSIQAPNGSWGYLSFVYPPLTLPLFGALSMVPPTLAYELWLLAKLAGLAALAVIWYRFLPAHPGAWWLTLLTLVGFRAASVCDIVTGNITILEQLVLWVGFLGLLRGRPGRFAVCVALLTQFKLMSIGFSVLLLLQSGRPLWKHFLATVAASSLLLAAGAAAHPGMFSRFLEVASGLDERGAVNPCLLALCRDLLDWLRVSASPAMPASSGTALYVAVASLVIAWTVPSMRRRDRADQILLALATFAVCAPRFKDYAYVALVPAAAAALARLDRGAAFAGLAALVLMPSQTMWLPGYAHVAFRVASAVPESIADATSLPMSYLPWLAALAVWFVLVSREALQRPCRPPRARETAARADPGIDHVAEHGTVY